MQKFLVKIFAVVPIIAALAVFSASAAYAATPVFSAYYTGSGDSVQINVSGADPNSSVLLENNFQVHALGTTDSSGSFTTTISTSQYNITPGGVTYVIVDNINSNSLQWPYTVSSGSFTLSQSSASIGVGQSSVITASVAGPFFLSSNSSAYVANASLSGNQITIVGNAAGTTNMSICLVSNTAGCASVAVTVSGSSGSQLTFSQNNLNMPFGQTATVGISGGTGVYAITNNSNPSSVQLTLSGSTLYIYSQNVSGSAAITVCSSDNSTCGVISVNVGSGASYSTLSFSQTNPAMAVGQSNTISIIGGTIPYYVSSNSDSGAVQTAISSNILTLSAMSAGTSVITVCSNSSTCGTMTVTVGASADSLVFSQNNISLNSGQSSSVQISGSGGYYISSNSNSNAVSASVSGSTLSLAAVSPGTDNIGICSSSGQCGVVYATVNGYSNTSSGSLSTSQVLSVGQGVNLYISGGTAPYHVASGSNGVYSASIASGNTLMIYGVGAGSSSVSVCDANNDCLNINVVVVGSASTSSSSATAPSSYQFASDMAVGDTGADVTALQNRLTKLGVYSGPITGYYGPLTEAAVRRYQTLRGITPVGAVGPQTRAMLNAGK
jgi:ferredoxin